MPIRFTKNALTSRAVKKLLAFSKSGGHAMNSCTKALSNLERAKTVYQRAQKSMNDKQTIYDRCIGGSSSKPKKG
jgi:hypothetical protein